jgi:protein-L-isoaspartate(D-aspartate) O-methyltransferase
MNVEQARFNMIEQQIRTWEVLDERVLSVLAEIPREKFVPEEHSKLAFADLSIPLPHGEEMMPPKVEARMLQTLSVRPDDVVLEVGTGSGYTTALLAAMAKQVYSVEIHPDLSASAQAKLAAMGIRNVTLDVGDAALGWDKHAPYDVIAITGSCPTLPDWYKNSLKIGGRMFVVVGERPIMEAMLITRTGDNAWSQESLFETDLRALVNAPRPQHFVF